MAAPVKTSMPGDVDIGAAFTLRIAALDQSTGNAVAGVTFSNMMLEVSVPEGADVTALEFGPFLLVAGPDA